MVHKCRDIQNKKEDVLVWIELFEEEGVSEENFKEIEEQLNSLKAELDLLEMELLLAEEEDKSSAILEIHPDRKSVV